MKTKPVEMITLRHASGVHASICTYGSRLHAFGYSDDSNVIVAPRDAQQYYQLPGYVGATIGPLANLVRDGKVETTRNIQQLDANYGRHHLHGGKHGMDKQHWAVRSQNQTDVSLEWVEQSIGRFTLNFEVLENGLVISYSVEAFRDLIVNMTNHAYFNLNRDRTIHRHRLQLNAQSIVSTDHFNIPLNEIENITGTQIDFRRPKGLEFLQSASSINEIEKYRGLNHCFIFQNGENEVTLMSPESEIPNLTIKTTKPAVHIYSSNNKLFINNERDEVHGALCIEPMYSLADQFQGDQMRSLVVQGAKYFEQDSYCFSC
ncbi:hypothetical protein [Thaumasiovibrio sp. DFM-14]|uniref:aldose epimerase family protein n=1 Tax=Thaumasiovibrio sp. DFM-14 TaxID=3384792 RepID=UPI0039A01DB6